MSIYVNFHRNSVNHMPSTGYCTKSTYVLEYCGRRTSNVMSDRRAAFDAAKRTRTGAKICVSQSVKEAEELCNQLESSVEVSKSEYVKTLKSLSTRLNAWRKAQADVEFLNENIQDGGRYRHG